MHYECKVSARNTIFINNKCILCICVLILTCAKLPFLQQSKDNERFLKDFQDFNFTVHFSILLSV